MAENVTKHVLVPKHTKLSEKERKELFEKLNIDETNLPKISKADPAIAHLDVEEGDIVKVIRKSETAGEVLFYRRVAL